MPHSRLTTAALAILAAVAPMAAAQDGERPDTTDNPGLQQRHSAAEPDQPGDTSTIAGATLGQPGGPRFTVRGGHRLQFESDFDDAPGDFSVNRTLLGVRVAGIINEKTSYSLDFQTEYSSYDFSEATSLAPGTDDPLNDALTINITPGLRYAIDDSWAVRAGVSMIISGETDADVGDSLRAGVFAGVERRMSEQLTLSVLVVAWTRLEEDPQVFPTIGLSWQINELTRVQTRGIGAEIISDLGNGWSLGARGAWEYREFRLSDSSSAPLPEGILRDSGIVTSLELAWKPSPDVVLALEGGGIFAQEFELADRRGRDITDTDADTSFFIGFRASIAF